jgi:uncharacterized protein (DUF983 family)
MSHKYVIGLLMFAVFLTGLGWLAVLPIGEGFDELTYYGYIQELADTRTLSIYRASYLSQDVIAYHERLPTAYSSVPPFEDLKGGVTYRRFFSSPVPKEALDTINGERNYVPSDALCYIAQHPPVFYAVMAPVYLLSKHWTWKAQMAILRTVSWAFAFVGYVLGIVATIKYWPESNAVKVAAISAAWPFLIPMFFPEMARLGSDSLCLLIIGGIWWMLLKIFAGKTRSKRRDLWILGVLLGVGLLTKAFFIPVTVGVALILILWGDRKGLAIIVIASFAIGCPWYLHNLLSTGVLTGGQEQVQLAKQGGLIDGLARNFSVYGLARGLAAVLATTVWAGTFSLARFHEWFLVPLAALLTVPVTACGVRLTCAQRGDFIWAPALIVLLFAAGLIQHVFVALAMTGVGNNTPGWYLHVLTVPLGFIYALGLLWLIKFGYARLVLIALTLYSIGYFAVVSWVQIAMYAGCVSKEGSVKYYAFPEGGSCLLDVGRIVRNLSIISEPYIGIPLLFGGIVLGVMGLAMLYSYLMRG